MAKETQKEKIERLERELEQVTKQRDEVFREVSALRKQINAAVEDTDAYKSIVAALQEEELKVKVARHSSELTEKMNRQLRNANAELQEKYDAAAKAYNALESNYKQVHEESRRNPFGAGRKRSYTAQLDQIMQLRESGSSIRVIASELGIPFATVARYIKENESK